VYGLSALSVCASMLWLEMFDTNQFFSFISYFHGPRV
jgi:hypothetical protein